MKIGLYFGSFNPVHHGHLIIAQHIINLGLYNEVWFVVSPQNPLKINTLPDEKHRKELIDIAIADPKLRSSDVEFNLPKPSYTVDTLIYLSQKFPEYNFEIIMGSDSFENIEKWKDFQNLLKEYRFVIYPRKNSVIKNKFQDNIMILDAPLIEISSTRIREMVKTGLSIKYMVPEKVKEAIERNGYYK